MASISLTNYASTNSVVGAFNAPGAAIRQKYWDLGTGPFGPSWSVAGWTADVTGSAEGCADSYCRLYVHYIPTPTLGHSGSKQDFRQHSEQVVVNGQTVSVQFSSVMAGRWAVNSARWIGRPFFLSWLFNAPYPGGAFSVSTGVPLMDRADNSSAGMCGQELCCRSTVGCVGYQRFHVGYIWEHQTQGVKTAVYCPDVVPYYPNQNSYVSVADIQGTVQAYPQSVGTLQPYEAWYYAWYDINGSGGITVADIQMVVGGYNRHCYAGAPT